MDRMPIHQTDATDVTRSSTSRDMGTLRHVEIVAWSCVPYIHNYTCHTLLVSRYIIRFFLKLLMHMTRVANSMNHLVNMLKKKNLIIKFAKILRACCIDSEEEKIQALKKGKHGSFHGQSVFVRGTGNQQIRNSGI